MGTGTILKPVAGIRVGMDIRVPGMLGDGYKYLSPCSSLVWNCPFLKMVKEIHLVVKSAKRPRLTLKIN